MLMQAACPQLQESSILSRTTFAQYGPQYLLPFSGAQLQAGCAHLSCVFVWRSLEVFSAIIVAPLLRTGVVVPRRHLGMRCPVRPSTTSFTQHVTWRIALVSSSSLFSASISWMVGRMTNSSVLPHVSLPSSPAELDFSSRL